MDRIIIEGQQPLSGSVKISGAKNAVLPIMAATLMVDGKSVLNRVPDLRDTRTMVDLIKIVLVRGSYWSEILGSRGRARTSTLIKIRTVKENQRKIK